jgi:hypothetical protein
MTFRSMKLRALVIALLLANLLVAGWYGGWFDFIVGIERRTGREPNRVLQQLKPQTIKVVPPGRAAPDHRPHDPASAPAGEPTPDVGPPRSDSHRTMVA